MMSIQPSTSSSLSPTILADISVNFYRPSFNDIKYPPGLGLGNLPAASESCPSLDAPRTTDAPPPKTGRRRSGSFYHVMNASTNSLSTLTSPVSFISTPPRQPRRNASLGSRSDGAMPYRASPTWKDSLELPPPRPRSPQGSKYFKFSSTLKFDPFGHDDITEPVFPSASSTSYSHYWQYDPLINGPKLCSYDTQPSPPARPSDVQYTIKLPPASSISSRSHSASSLPQQPQQQSPKQHSSWTQTPTQSSRRRQSSPVPDKNARAKLVAGILLNRIHAVGKPMRRRFGLDRDVEKAYVKSGLSSVITVEC